MTHRRWKPLKHDPTAVVAFFRVGGYPARAGRFALSFIKDPGNKPSFAATANPMETNIEIENVERLRRE